MLDTAHLQKESALKTLPRKISRSGQITVLSRADYEGRGLKHAHTAQRRAVRGLLNAADDTIAQGWSRELDRWLERERILLRIKMPGSDHGPMKPLLEQPAMVLSEPAPAAAQPSPTPSPSTNGAQSESTIEPATPSPS